MAHTLCQSVSQALFISTTHDFSARRECGNSETRLTMSKQANVLCLGLQLAGDQPPDLADVHVAVAGDAEPVWLLLGRLRLHLKPCHRALERGRMHRHRGHRPSLQYSKEPWLRVDRMKPNTYTHEGPTLMVHIAAAIDIKLVLTHLALFNKVLQEGQAARRPLAGHEQLPSHRHQRHGAGVLLPAALAGHLARQQGGRGQELSQAGPADVRNEMVSMRSCLAYLTLQRWLLKPLRTLIYLMLSSGTAKQECLTTCSLACEQGMGWTSHFSRCHIHLAQV